MQQLPRDNTHKDDDGNVIWGFSNAVKGCIKARPGYKIVSMDLTTAEVYVAAVLAKDKNLMEVFSSGGDFHSTIAKMVFSLDCPVEEVKEKYPLLRQAAKAITFGIMYQAGPAKIAWQIAKDSGIHCSREQAQEYIDDYFKKFRNLRKWIDENKNFIAANGFAYSHFGRKRRLPNVFSSDRAIAGHTTRSGINFLVQSVASDINLLGGIEMQLWLDEHPEMDARIFALVHDSILAEVREEQVDEYLDALRGFIQKDRGVSIPGSPIGCDFEIGDDYSFDKYEKYEAAWDAEHAV